SCRGRGIFSVLSGAIDNRSHIVESRGPGVENREPSAGFNEPHVVTQRLEKRQGTLILLNGFLIPRETQKYAGAPGAQIGSARGAFIFEQGNKVVQLIECLFVSGCAARLPCGLGKEMDGLFPVRPRSRLVQMMRESRCVGVDSG